MLLDNSICLHTQSARASKFYTTFPSPGHIRFESVKFQGRFLLIDHRKGKLKLGEPKNGNDIFKILHLNDPVLSAFRDSENCYFAFDKEGEQVGPCGLNITENSPMIRMRYMIV